jgi:chemotaxis protein MotB
VRKIELIAIAAVIGTSSCISVATHEQQMKRCHEMEGQLKVAEARVKQLEDEKQQLAEEVTEKSAEKEGLQEKISDIRATYDDLVEELKGELSNGNVNVHTSGEDLTITLGDKVLFHSGQTELLPQGRDILGSVVKVLKFVNDRVVQVEGYTDNISIAGKLKSQYPSNWELSAARAAVVVRYLQQLGIRPENLMLAGFSEYHPLGSNATPKGRALNRRVEITLVKKPSEKKSDEKK